MNKLLILIAILISTLLIFSTGYATSIQQIMMYANNSPPGLQGKGGEEFPKGLEKQEKVPKGWFKGEKRGWFHHHHHHGHHSF